MDSVLNDNANLPVLDLLNEDFHSAGISSYSKTM